MSTQRLALSRVAIVKAIERAIYPVNDYLGKNKEICSCSELQADEASFYIRHESR